MDFGMCRDGVRVRGGVGTGAHVGGDAAELWAVAFGAASCGASDAADAVASGGHPGDGASVDGDGASRELVPSVDVGTTVASRRRTTVICRAAVHSRVGLPEWAALCHVARKPFGDVSALAWLVGPVVVPGARRNKARVASAREAARWRGRIAPRGNTAAPGRKLDMDGDMSHNFELAWL